MSRAAEMVRAEGLEPPHLSTTGPKPAASTNSATRADAVGGAAYSKDRRLGKPPSQQLFALPRRSEVKEPKQCNNFRHSPTSRTSRRNPSSRSQRSRDDQAKPPPRSLAGHPISTSRRRLRPERNRRRRRSRRSVKHFSVRPER